MEQYTIQLFSDSPYQFFKECVLSKEQVAKYPTIQNIIDLDNGEDNSIIPLRYKNVKILYAVLTTDYLSTDILSTKYESDNIFNTLEAVDFLGNNNHVNRIMDYIRKYYFISNTWLTSEQKKLIRNDMINTSLSLQYYLLCGLCTIDIEYEVTVSDCELKYSNNLDYLLIIDHNVSAKGCVVYNKGQLQLVDKTSLIYCNIGHLQNTIVDNGDIYIFNAKYNSNATWLEQSVNNYYFSQHYADNCYKKNRLIKVIDAAQQKIFLVSTSCDKCVAMGGTIYSIPDLQKITTINNILYFSPTMKTIIHNYNTDKSTYNITNIINGGFKTVEVKISQYQSTLKCRPTWSNLCTDETCFMFSPNEHLFAEITRYGQGDRVRIITSEGNIKSKTTFSTMVPLLLTDNYLVLFIMMGNKIYLEINDISGTKDYAVPCYSQSIIVPQNCTFSGNVSGRSGPNDTFLIICTINPCDRKLRSQKWVRKYKIRKFVDTSEFLQTL